MELTGKIIKALKPNTFNSKSNGNQYTVQEFVIEMPGQYPHRCCFSVFGEERLLQTANILQEGNDVTVSLDIDAREYNGRWFNSFRCWKAALAMQDAQNTPISSPESSPVQAPAPQPTQQQIVDSVMPPKVEKKEKEPIPYNGQTDELPF